MTDMTDLKIPQVAAIDAVRPRRTLLYAKRLAIAVVLFLLIGGAVRFFLNDKSAESLVTLTNNSLQRTVVITQGRPGELKRNVTLPATLRGNTETTIYSRSNGYLAAWHKTIGDRVKKGELLATIDAPEQDHELAQATAVREQINARLNLSRLTMERWQSLRQRDGVSQQELEEKRSALIQAEADFTAANANVKRLEQLKDFRRIVAPFAGVVTRRSVDVGNLIGAGGKELFALTQTDPLRLTVWVPQVYASNIAIGKEVSVSLSEFQGTRFTAVVDRMAGGIDPQSHSRQLDITLPNPDGKLLPGAYAEVDISLSSGAKALVVPASVLIIGSDGPRVAVVDTDNRIVFRAVKLGHDLGKEVEVLNGLTSQDTLVVSPSDLLAQGEVVATAALTKVVNKKSAVGKNESGTDQKSRNDNVVASKKL